MLSTCNRTEFIFWSSDASAATNSVAARLRLEELRRQELDHYRAEPGAVDAASEQVLEAMTAQLVQGIAGLLARELKRLSGPREQEEAAAMLRQLFEVPEKSAARSKAVSTAPFGALAGNA